jgi:uncharacterized membrane protein YagU involved in acid resistance
MLKRPFRVFHKQKKDFRFQVLGGAAAGLLSSVLMGIIMKLMQEQLPSSQKYHLPPREITIALMAHSGADQELQESSNITTLTTIGHLGYGSIGGVNYSLLSGYIPLPAIFKGGLFGLVVWAVSYLGWIPATGILSPVTRHPRERTLLMIAAHLVYGAATALLTELFLAKRKLNL